MALPCARDGPLVALAFKLEEGRFGQLTYMRIYSGTVRKGDVVTNVATGKRVKVWAACAVPCLSHSILRHACMPDTVRRISDAQPDNCHGSAQIVVVEAVGCWAA